MVSSSGSANIATVKVEGKANYLFDHPFGLKRYPLPKSVLVEQVLIPTRDGINLAATLFRPRTADPVPAIVTATLYGKDNYNQWTYFQDPPEGNIPGGAFYMGDVTVSDHTAFEAPDPGFWVANGYAVMLVDLPGFGRSELDPAATPGPEARWADIFAWVEKQKWSTGKVGMSGVSALCCAQWIAAKEAAPSQLKAIVPWEGFNETGPAGGYGGVPEVAFPDWLRNVWIGPNINPQARGPEPFLFDWKYDTSSIKVPALVCASFSDQELHTWDTFDAFTRLKSADKWLYTHRRQKWGAYYGKPELELQKRFFDRFLKSDERAMDGVPRVQLEINRSRSDYKRVYADDWPIPDTTYQPLFLDAKVSQLRTEQPQQASTSVFGPTPANDPDNRAVFDFTFQKETYLVGHMALKLFVEIEDSDDLDFLSFVKKLDRQGDEVYFFSASGGAANGPVTRGWLRASHRTLNKARSTLWRPVLAMSDPQPAPAGQVIELDIPLMPSGTIFQEGDVLRLVVQSWAAAAGQWEGGVWDTIKTGRCRLHTGPSNLSRLLVPVVDSKNLRQA